MELLLIAVLSCLLTAIAAWLFFHTRMRDTGRQLEQRYQKKISTLLYDRDEARQILATIDLGLACYASNGEARLINAAARELLQDIPNDYHSFLDLYGAENGMSANLALGKESVDAIVSKSGRMIYVRVQSVSGASASGHLVMLRDVTRQFREEQQRKEYVSNVSHELKTPLTTIKTYSESLLDWGVDEKEKEAVKHDVSKIYEDSIRMEQLINDLYLLSSVDENSIGRFMRVELLDLIWMIKNQIEMLQPQAEKKKMRLDCSSPAQMPRIYADRAQIERISGNLISNALKYGRSGGRIDVYLGYLRDEVYLKVKDDGVGISPEHQKHIFERFYRVDDSRARQLGGRGLGLAIVKELVELHGGSIAVESELARGSEFTVLLPSAEKTLRQTFYDLCHGNPAGGPIAQAAERDLTQLAESLGIVAQWESLNAQQYQSILAQLKSPGTGLSEH